MSFKTTIKPIALTTRLSPNNKHYVYINLLYIMTDPYKKGRYWHAQCIQVINTKNTNLKNIVDMLCLKHQVVFLDGITRGEEVKKKHINKLNDKLDLFTFVKIGDQKDELCKTVKRVQKQTKRKKLD